MKLQNLVPMLNTRNIEISLEFYQKALGFTITSDPDLVKDWRWASLRSGNTELMLSESGGWASAEKNTDPHEKTDWPVIFYFYPDDVCVLHAHIVNAGYTPTPITVTHYGMREFSISDPDGHMLSFGEDPE